MLALFRIRKGMTAPFLEVVITKEGTVTQVFNPPAIGCGPQGQGTFNPVDLSTVSLIRARMWKCGRTKAEKILLGTTEIVDAEQGLVRYKWDESDTDTTGVYYFSFEITFTDSSKILWPYVAEIFPIEITE